MQRVAIYNILSSCTPTSRNAQEYTILKYIIYNNIMHVQNGPTAEQIDSLQRPREKGTADVQRVFINTHGGGGSDCDGCETCRARTHVYTG